MFRSAVSLLIVLMFGGVANAEKYVVDLECVVFDRELTDAENKQIRERIQDLPRKDQGPTYGEERLRLLRQNARQLFVHKCTLVVGPTETASQQMETNSVLMEAHIRVIEANEESCKLDIQWGFAAIVDERRSSAGSHTEERWVPIGKKQPLSGGGIEGFHRQFLIHVRKATDDDLVPKKLPKNFGLDIHKKLQRAGRGGDLIL